MWHLNEICHIHYKLGSYNEHQMNPEKQHTYHNMLFSDYQIINSIQVVLVANKPLWRHLLQFQNSNESISLGLVKIEWILGNCFSWSFLSIMCGTGRKWRLLFEIVESIDSLGCRFGNGLFSKLAPGIFITKLGSIFSGVLGELFYFGFLPFL